MTAEEEIERQKVAERLDCSYSSALVGRDEKCRVLFSLFCYKQYAKYRWVINEKNHMRTFPFGWKFRTHSTTVSLCFYGTLQKLGENCRTFHGSYRIKK